MASISPGAGLRKKLIFKLVVTASSTGPTCASTRAYTAASASPIITGPAMVPPGRKNVSL